MEEEQSYQDQTFSRIVNKRGKTRGGFYLSWPARPGHLDNRRVRLPLQTFAGLYSYNFVSQDSDVGQSHLSKTKYP